MSYQVNYRLFLCDCQYWEAEAAAKLQAELHDACMKVFKENGLGNRQCGLSSAEVSYLTT